MFEVRLLWPAWLLLQMFFFFFMKTVQNTEVAFITSVYVDLVGMDSDISFHLYVTPHFSFSWLFSWTASLLVTMGMGWCGSVCCWVLPWLWQPITMTTTWVSVVLLMTSSQSNYNRKNTRKCTNFTYTDRWHPISACAVNVWKTPLCYCEHTLRTFFLISAYIIYTTDFLLISPSMKVLWKKQNTTSMPVQKD